MAEEAGVRAAPDLQAEAKHLAPPPAPLLPKSGMPPPSGGMPTMPAPDGPHAPARAALQAEAPPPPPLPKTDKPPSGGSMPTLPVLRAPPAPPGESPRPPSSLRPSSPDAAAGTTPAAPFMPVLEAAPRGLRDLQAEAKHGMEVPPLPKLSGPPAKGGVPPLPKLSGPPPGTPPRGGSLTPGTPGPAGTPGTRGDGTPVIGTPGGPSRLDGRRPSHVSTRPVGGYASTQGSEPGTPSTAMHSEVREGFVAKPPPGTPPVVIGPSGITNGIVHRGAPSVVPPPFQPPSQVPEGGQRAKFGPPGGGLFSVPPPPKGGSPFTVPPPTPPPPPPPREDDATFIRRMRLQFMEKAEKEHRKIVQHELEQITPWHTPGWVQCIAVVCPYLACTLTIGFEVVLNLSYSLKFGDTEESHFISASVLSLAMVLVIMDVMRCALTTIYELRKYENRRRLLGGEYNVSKLKRMAEGNPEPAMKLKQPAPNKPRTLAPKVPSMKVPPPPPPTDGRPSFLPPEGGPSFVDGPGGQRPPVGVPTPPPGEPPIRRASNSGSRSPAIGTRAGGSLMPGRLDGRSNVPGLPQFAPPRDGPSVTQTLTESLEARKIAGAPPLPGPPPPPPPAFGKRH